MSECRGLKYVTNRMMPGIVS